MENKKSGKGAAALTLGIISIVAAIFWYISLPTGILAIVLGTKAIKKEGSKTGRAGLVTGIIGLSLLAAIYLTLILALLMGNVYYY